MGEAKVALGARVALLRTNLQRKVVKVRKTRMGSNGKVCLF